MNRDDFPIRTRTIKRIARSYDHNDTSSTKEVYEIRVGDDTHNWRHYFIEVIEDDEGEPEKVMFNLRFGEVHIVMTPEQFNNMVNIMEAIRFAEIDQTGILEKGEEDEDDMPDPPF